MEKTRYLLLDKPFNALDDEGCSMLFSILDEEKGDHYYNDTSL